MAAARKTPDEQTAVFATVHLLPNFKPGERLDGHLTPEVIALLLARGEASHDAPAVIDADPEPQAPEREPEAAADASKE